MDPAIFAPRSSLVTTRHRCCVKNCKSQANINRGLGFHQFPRANTYFVNRKNEMGVMERVDRLDAWKIALDMKKTSCHMKICSLHFRKDDYFFPEIDAKKRVLKKNAVPTLFVPNDFFKYSPAQHLAPSVKKENIGSTNDVEIKQEIEFVCVKTEPVDELLMDEDRNLPSTANAYSMASSHKDYIPNEFVNTNSRKSFQDAAVQVESKHMLPKFLDFIQNDTELYTMTSISSSIALEAVVNSIKKEYGDIFEKPSCVMKTKDRVIMTCFKIKYNLPSSFVMIMFRGYGGKMSETNFDQIFQDMVKILYTCLTKASENDVVAITLKRFHLEKYQKAVMT